jgi:hypothetical protein
MEFSRNDKVVNTRTGEFGVFEAAQEVTTASGEKLILYQVQPDRDNAPRVAWRAEEIALWPKIIKPTH